MKQDESTPGPWVLSGPDEFGDYYISSQDSILAIAAVIQNGFRDKTETAAYAAFIVEACNSFNSLREALAPFAAAHERFEAGLDDCTAEYFDNSEICDGVTWGDLRRARAALKGVPQPASEAGKLSTDDEVKS